MRVDDNLSIRDVGTTGDEPQTGVVRYLLDQAFMDKFARCPAGVKNHHAYVGGLLHHVVRHRLTREVAA